MCSPPGHDSITPQQPQKRSWGSIRGDTRVLLEQALPHLVIDNVTRILHHRRHATQAGDVVIIPHGIEPMTAPPSGTEGVKKRAARLMAAKKARIALTPRR